MISEIERLVRNSAASLLIQSLTDPGKLVKFHEHLIHLGFTRAEADMEWLCNTIADELNKRMPPSI